MGIDWDGIITGSFVKLEDGVVTKLKLRNWQPQTTFLDEKTKKIRGGVVFDVYQKDNATYDDTTKISWTVTAKGALVLLKPIILKAEAQGKNEIFVSVVRVGENKKATYSIKEITE